MKIFLWGYKKKKISFLKNYIKEGVSRFLAFENINKKKARKIFLMRINRLGKFLTRKSEKEMVKFFNKRVEKELQHFFIKKLKRSENFLGRKVVKKKGRNTLISGVNTFLNKSGSKGMDNWLKKPIKSVLANQLKKGVKKFLNKDFFTLFRKNKQDQEINRIRKKKFLNEVLLKKNSRRISKFLPYKLRKRGLQRYEYGLKRRKRRFLKRLGLRQSVKPLKRVLFDKKFDFLSLYAKCVQINFNKVFVTKYFLKKEQKDIIPLIINNTKIKNKLKFKKRKLFDFKSFFLLKLIGRKNPFGKKVKKKLWNNLKKKDRGKLLRSYFFNKKSFFWNKIFWKRGWMLFGLKGVNLLNNDFMKQWFISTRRSKPLFLKSDLFKQGWRKNFPSVWKKRLKKKIFRGDKIFLDKLRFRFSNFVVNFRGKIKKHLSLSKKAINKNVKKNIININRVEKELYKRTFFVKSLIKMIKKYDLNISKYNAMYRRAYRKSKGVYLIKYFFKKMKIF